MEELLEFTYEGIPIPTKVEPASEDNITWAVPLFKALAEKTDSPGELWNLLFTDIFLDERFTLEHQYSICIIFSAQITHMYMEIQYGQMFATYQEAMDTANTESPIIDTKLIY